MKTARLVFFPIKISRKTRSEEVGRLPLTHTGGYFFRCRPEVHKAEFPPEPGIRVRRVSKKRRLYDNTVRGLKGREQFLYLHKKRANSVLGDLPKLAPRDTGVATQKNNPKGIADQMPELAKAFVGDQEGSLARHEMSGQTEKPVSGHGNLRRKRRTVIWHLAGSGIVVIQLCLGRTKVSQTLDCKIDLRGEVGWIVKVPSQVPPTVPSEVPPRVQQEVPPSVDSSHGTSKESSAGHKDSHNTDDIGFLRPPRNTTQLAGEIDPSVTTRQLLLPSQPGKAAFLLPIWIPSPDSFIDKCSPDTEGGRRGSVKRRSRRRDTDNVDRKFRRKGSPVAETMSIRLITAAWKYSAQQNQGHKKYRL